MSYRQCNNVCIIHQGRDSQEKKLIEKIIEKLIEIGHVSTTPISSFSQYNKLQETFQ